MSATLDPIVFTLRVGVDHHKYGDPYTFSATVLRVGKTAHIVGGCGELATPFAWRKALKNAGFTRVCWERMVDGTLVPYEYDLEGVKNG
jgi:hypothetical protein